MNNGIMVILLDFEMMWGAIFNKQVEQVYLYRTKYISKIDVADYYRYFSSETIKAIANQAGQEIATHTYSHFYQGIYRPVYG